MLPLLLLAFQSALKSLHTFLYVPYAGSNLVLPYEDLNIMIYVLKQMSLPSEPWGIALDITNRIIYYSDYTTDGVSSLDMANFTTPGSASLVAGTARNSPRQIAFGAETS